MLPSGPTLRHVLVVGVDGVRFVVVTDHGHLDRGGHGGREPEVATAWAAAAGPGIQPADRALITGQTQIAPLAVAALGTITGS